ncbi:anthranilate synthase component I family protein [Effusibacillus pohliae]|uniref:anthranilate synthase component I family protein n=1 Tax=Effusibacillus pohliae TaxID=232270 RepID=UPI000370F732|nr:anthranilate synthase component I family protein [Effusibacillus pohliae]
MRNSIKPERAAAERLLATYRVVPVWMEAGKAAASPWDLYLRTPAGNHRFLLESGKAGRYSLIGGDPRTILQVKNGLASDGTSGHPLQLLRKLLQERRAPRNRELTSPEQGASELPPFLCGLVGFLAYDLARAIERLPEIAVDDLLTPDLYVVEPGWLIVIDHQTEELYLATSMSSIDEYEQAERRLHEIWRWIADEPLHSEQRDADGHTGRAPLPEGTRIEQGSVANTSSEGTNASQQRVTHSPEDSERSLSQPEFEAAVERIKEYIRAGDVFQVNLSLRESRPIRVSPRAVYDQLRRINPSPYMGLIEFPELSLVSCSPELLVRLRGDQAETRPIAGTRKRSGDREHDLRMLQELIENEKERAEHIMLVDLERNDLGRVCEYGTVSVDELMTIEEYSHVMHIVSHISGRLREGFDAVDLVAATFPGGTITGAPKIRTMEIIEELEPVRRGVYTGSFGWWSFNGDMELNIAIRTMVVQNGRAYVQAGAGVVIDSIPEREYKESLRKAEALWQAFETAHRDSGVAR